MQAYFLLSGMPAGGACHDAGRVAKYVWHPSITTILLGDPAGQGCGRQGCGRQGIWGARRWHGLPPSPPPPHPTRRRLLLRRAHCGRRSTRRRAILRAPAERTRTAAPRHMIARDRLAAYDTLLNAPALPRRAPALPALRQGMQFRRPAHVVRLQPRRHCPPCGRGCNSALHGTTTRTPKHEGHWLYLLRPSIGRRRELRAKRRL